MASYSSAEIIKAKFPHLHYMRTSVGRIMICDISEDRCPNYTDSSVKMNHETGDFEIVYLTTREYSSCGGAECPTHRQNQPKS